MRRFVNDHSRGSLLSVRVRLALMLALLVLATFPAAVYDAVAQPDPALAGVCYATLGNNGSSPGALITIDRTTGAGAVVGPTGISGALGDTGVPALAIKRSGEIFAMDIGAASSLYRIDATTGTATLIAATSLNSPPAIAFDGDDVLWAVDTSGNLYAMNDVTGEAFLEGPTGAFIKGMAFDPTDGSLWGTDASGDVFTIDFLDGGAASLVGNTGQSPSPDICFDLGGSLFGSSGGGLAANNLISIDKTSGAGTVIGPIGFASVAGMASRLDRAVPVFVRALESRWAGDHVELTWSLLEPAGDISFEVRRAEHGGRFELLDGATIESSLDGFVLVDRSVRSGTTYSYEIRVREQGSVVASLETSVSTPRLAISLDQNHPNPFNPRTQIRFALTDAGQTSLRVFDLSGRLVRTLLDRRLPAGAHVESWDGTDDGGDPVSGGTYVYRLRTDWQVISRKAVLLK